MQQVGRRDTVSAGVWRVKDAHGAVATRARPRQTHNARQAQTLVCGPGKRAAALGAACGTPSQRSVLPLQYDHHAECTDGNHLAIHGGV